MSIVLCVCRPATGKAEAEDRLRQEFECSLGNMVRLHLKKQKLKISIRMGYKEAKSCTGAQGPWAF